MSQLCRVNEAGAASCINLCPKKNRGDLASACGSSQPDEEPFCHPVAVTCPLAPQSTGVNHEECTSQLPARGVQVNR